MPPASIPHTLHGLLLFFLKHFEMKATFKPVPKASWIIFFRLPPLNGLTILMVHTSNYMRLIQLCIFF